MFIRMPLTIVLEHGTMCGHIYTQANLHTHTDAYPPHTTCMHIPTHMHPHVPTRAHSYTDTGTEA